ncbi:Indoleamine 2,3-dioxygenase [Ceraceosorus guamensis]|uniref:Indoleamine 2,3-dioxygenase n=1 Tax=Ceraceosorus guamensis TaxID=1522189 RepID=A0A316VSB5_9BASI|nr:Indoleamine 2,3-dioxygenase [Ceraceosorus guamensis]PWN39303.1 Indoleamine 2,3-dioxygenase [Ceraceosorus guamensis]
MPDTSTLAAADFDIDVRSGFLPPEAPLSRLSDVYEEWESKLEGAAHAGLSLYGGGPTTNFHRRASARRWRRSIREMPILPLQGVVLADIRHARRAHLVLSFLAHFYLHSQPEPTEDSLAPLAQGWNEAKDGKGKGREHDVSLEAADDAADAAQEAAGIYAATVPASLAVPWTGLSRHLDLPPILTYATTVLWNWQYKDPARGLALDNVKIRNTFSGTASEEHFYLISLLIELRGVEALELMRISLDEAFVADHLARRRIAHYLSRLVAVVHDLTTLLAKMKEACDPVTFYWGIRPWFRGGDSAPRGGQGWIYEGVDEPGQKRLLNGPSAGQSSLIHALDVFLDVDHTRLKPRGAAHSARQQPDVAHALSERDAGIKENATFMEKMQMYMPGPHRAFLTHLRNLSFDDDHETFCRLNGLEGASPSTSPPSDSASSSSDDMDVDNVPPPPSHPIRSLAIAKEVSGKPFQDDLASAYDAALISLRVLRDEHMRIAALYIISQARKQPPPEYAPLPKNFTGRAEVERVAGAQQSDAKEAPGAPKGTGGTDLVSFLKACRSNTTDALLGPLR